jgi:hypothetical protein
MSKVGKKPSIFCHIPWSEGKRPITRAMMGFLVRWARHLSWRQWCRLTAPFFLSAIRESLSFEDGSEAVRRNSDSKPSAVSIETQAKKQESGRKRGKSRSLSFRGNGVYGIVWWCFINACER